MSTSSQDETLGQWLTPFGTNFSEHRKPDLRKVGRDIYEVLTNTGRHGYKQRMRKRTIKIEPERNYAPSEVAAILARISHRQRFREALWRQTRLWRCFGVGVRWVVVVS